MKKATKKRPSKDELIDKLMEVVNNYYVGTDDEDTPSPISTSEMIRAVEVINRMLGFNEPEVVETTNKVITFEIG